MASGGSASDAGTVESAIESLEHALLSVDPISLSGPECAALADRLGRTGRALAAARFGLILRAADLGGYPGAGTFDAADWVAAMDGASRSEALSLLRTADHLDRLPATARALAGGEISVRQAREVARTATEVPAAEAALLDVARRSDVTFLRDEARRVRLASIDPRELRRRQVRARHHRKWINELGMPCGSYALLPGEGMPFHAALDAETDRRVRAEKVARNPRERPAGDGASPVAEADPEVRRRDQHAADAFVAAINGEAPVGRVRPQVVLVADVTTVAAGDDSVGNGCHMVGGGPIPVVDVLDALRSGEAFVKGVVHDGVDILNVRHYGRYIPAELRTALEVGRPPSFDGLACSEPGCGRRYGVQIDHRVPVAARGPTSYQNLQGLCWVHHRQKTDEDRLAGLLTPEAPGSTRARPPP